MLGWVAPPTTADTGKLLEQLRAGGLVLVFAAAEAPAPDEPNPPASASDCRAPRSLSPAGQGLAKALGDGFRNRELDFETVLSSPDCRSRHTAFLAIGADWVGYREGLASDCASANPAAFEAALTELMAAVPAGRNRLVFAQACALRGLDRWQQNACPRSLQPGDALVMQPSGSGRLLGCLDRRYWVDSAARPHWSRRLEDLPPFPFRTR